MVNRWYGLVKKKSNHTAVETAARLPASLVAVGCHRDHDENQHQRRVGVREPVREQRQDGAHDQRRQQGRRGRHPVTFQQAR